MEREEIKEEKEKGGEGGKVGGEERGGRGNEAGAALGSWRVRSDGKRDEGKRSENLNIDQTESVFLWNGRLKGRGVLGKGSIHQQLLS